MGEVLITAPPLEIPVPRMVKASALAYVMPFKSKTAPLAKLTPPATVPKAVVLPNFRIPPLMVIAPE